MGSLAPSCPLPEAGGPPPEGSRPEAPARRGAAHGLGGASGDSYRKADGEGRELGEGDGRREEEGEGGSAEEPGRGARRETRGRAREARGEGGARGTRRGGGAVRVGPERGRAAGAGRGSPRRRWEPAGPAPERAREGGLRLKGQIWGRPEKLGQRGSMEDVRWGLWVWAETGVMGWSGKMGLRRGFGGV